MRTLQNYLLRYAAGSYWVFRTDQQEANYIKPFLLNETGAELWRILETGCEVAEISEILQKKYKITSGQAEEDIQQFLHQLRDNGII